LWHSSNDILACTHQMQSPKFVINLAVVFLFPSKTDYLKPVLLPESSSH
jgi:hypothetical protein